MSNIHHGLADDVESSSFLPREVKERSSEDVEFAPGLRRRWTMRYVIFHTLPYVVIALIFFGLGRHSSPTVAKDENRSAAQSIVGQVPHKSVVFEPDDRFNDDPFGPDTLHSAWHKLAPLGKGHIRVNDPSSWNISGGYPLNDTSHPAAEEYTLSMFHQLHCLAAIKSKMSRLQDWYKGENDKEYLRFALGEEYIRDEHIYHCFDYIRQSVMCAGDTALERARVVNGRVVKGVDGWGVEHQCRDWDVFFKWSEDHRTGDVEGID